jgi:2-hydroxy-3-keto-5-methylthiopentenyl-1-phosphate phosphatase
MMPHPNEGPAGVLVSDFDGTMTRYDFYKLVVECLLPPETPDYWARYRAGSISHFEALRRYFASIRASEKEVLSVLKRMQLDPHLRAAVETLDRAGWKVVVASAGCAWYIRQLLHEAGVELEVHSNPGQFEMGKGLLMELPTGSAYLSRTVGIDKAAVVRHFIASGRPVAFAGDGFPDAEPARLVPDHLRFARGDLANVLLNAGVPFRRFETWSHIPHLLLNRGP